MKSVTYLIYIILFKGVIFSAGYHVVFNLNNSGWWILVAFIVGGTIISPRRWAALWDKEIQLQIHNETLAKIKKENNVYD